MDERSDERMVAFSDTLRQRSALGFLGPEFR